MTPAKELKRTPDQSRQPIHLASGLDKTLLGYAAAAGAAGVSLLALVQPAEGKVIFTPSNIAIPQNSGLVQFDLNHDGIPDFGISNVHFGDTRGIRAPIGSYASHITIVPAQASNEVGAVLSARGTECAVEVGKGRRIGPHKNFQPNSLPMYSIAGSASNPGMPHCPWGDNDGGFLGLKFVVSGQTYYGWAHISISNANYSITGYAYEDTPNQPILSGATSGPDERTSLSADPVLPVPQAAGLGLLALGAPGLTFWRRPEGSN
jgi:hypothetical protein